MFIGYLYISLRNAFIDLLSPLNWVIHLLLFSCKSSLYILDASLSPVV